MSDWSRSGGRTKFLTDCSFKRELELRGPTGKNNKDGQSDGLVDDRLRQDVETPQTLKSGSASDPLPVAKRSWPRPARGRDTHCSSEPEWHDAQCLASCMADV